MPREEIKTCHVVSGREGSTTGAGGGTGSPGLKPDSQGLSLAPGSLSWFLLVHPLDLPRPPGGTCCLPPRTLDVHSPGLFGGIGG